MSSSKSSIPSFDEISLAIVDGNFLNMGKILYGNKVLLKYLDYKKDDVSGKTVKLLMPLDIATVHDVFWNRFKETGVPNILERERFLFVKDKQGCVFPFKIFIKFIYHHHFGYTFLGLFQKPKQIILNEVENPIPIGKVFHFITNSQGRITEISKSCQKIIGMN